MAVLNSNDGGGGGGSGGGGGGEKRSTCNDLWPLVVESLWLQDTLTVLPSVVICGRLTLLSYSKIFLLHHDPTSNSILQIQESVKMPCL